MILTPGRYNAAYFEHSYFAEQTGAHLVTGSELIVENDHLYFIDYTGKKERVGAVYRRISDEYLDPMNFYKESVIGIPHIYDIYRKGNVALLNAPGNGVADDKGIYYFVPKMIRYYGRNLHGSEKSGSACFCSDGRGADGMEEWSDTVFQKPGFFHCQFITGRRI